VETTMLLGLEEFDLNCFAIFIFLGSLLQQLIIHSIFYIELSLSFFCEQ